MFAECLHTDVGVPVSACFSLAADSPFPYRGLPQTFQVFRLPTNPDTPAPPWPSQLCHQNLHSPICYPISHELLTYVRIQLANRCVTSPTETTSTQPPGRAIFLHSSACFLNIYPWRHQPHLLEYCPNRTSTL